MVVLAGGLLLRLYIWRGNYSRQMLLARQLNLSLSRRCMCIPIAFYPIFIVAIVCRAVRIVFLDVRTLLPVSCNLCKLALDPFQFGQCKLR